MMWQLTGGNGILRNRKVKALIEQAAKRPEVRAGILEGATNYETGEPIAPYAAMNEYGAPGIPSRPFLRRTIDTMGKQWSRLFRRAVKAGKTIPEALETVGHQMRGDIVATINSNMPPPNAPATIARKMRPVTGGKKGERQAPGTLIDTGSMVKSIDYKVLP